MPRIGIESFDAEHDARQTETSSASFDRIAFAERAIALVRPPSTCVAIREGTRRVQLEAGRQWGAHGTARWAVLSVPPDASRKAIADAVLEIATDRGARTPRVRPYALELLLSSCEDP